MPIDLRATDGETYRLLTYRDEEQEFQTLLQRSGDDWVEVYDRENNTVRLSLSQVVTIRRT